MQSLIGKTTGDALSAAEWNQLPAEVQNVITALGIALSGADLNQLGKAIAGYVANGAFYTDSGAANAYVFTQIGSKQAPTAYTVGMRVRGIISVTNTGASTANVAGLGVKNIKTKSGGNPQGGDLTATEMAEFRYDGVNLVLEQTGNQIFIATIQSRTAAKAPVFKDALGREMGQLSKAWVNFNGTGTIAIRDSFNVSSLTDNGVGDYDVNLANTIASINSPALSGCSDGAGGFNRTSGAIMTSTSVARVTCSEAASGTIKDVIHVFVNVLANQ